MLLFGKKKKDAPAAQAKEKDCEVKVLGSGCSKCNALEAAVKEALVQLGREPEVEHVTDYARIAAYGVMQTPALVVKGKVMSFGKVLKPEEAADLLRQGLGEN